MKLGEMAIQMRDTPHIIQMCKILWPRELYATECLTIIFFVGSGFSLAYSIHGGNIFCCSTIQFQTFTYLCAFSVYLRSAP